MCKESSAKFGIKLTFLVRKTLEKTMLSQHLSNFANTLLRTKSFLLHLHSMLGLFSATLIGSGTRTGYGKQQHLHGTDKPRALSQPDYKQILVILAITN